LTLKVAHGAGPEGRCFPPGARPSDESLTAAHVDLLRLTVRDHGAGDVKGSFRCDRVLQVPLDQPTLQIDVSRDQSVDLFAEGFQRAAADDPDNAVGGEFRRVATGSLLGVGVHGGAVPVLRLYPVGEFRCVDARLHVARAFHTATPLPTGQVLIVGGTVASPNDGAREDLDDNQLFVTATIELYDPATGTFDLIGVTNQARAFHQAVLLNDTPPYQILLVGGIQATGDGLQPALAPNVGTTQYEARLAPSIPGLIPTPLPTQAAPPEILTFDPFKRSVASTPGPLLPAGAFQGGAPVPGGIAVAGGLNWDDAGTTLLTNADRLAVSGTVVRVAALSTPRSGATLTTLSGDRGLVWGGAFDVGDPVGDLVTGLTALSPSTSAVMLAGVPMTQFHTATAVGPTRILVTGGFEVMSGQVAIQPPRGDASLHLINAATSLTVGKVALDGYVADPTCSLADRYRPAGYEAALALDGRPGEILVTGGAPSFDTCNDCEEGQVPGPLCSLHQASRLRAAATLTRILPMQMSRFGHTLTTLGDGTVLVTGGLTLPPGAETARAIADAEIYNPRDGLPRFDPDHPEKNDLDDPLERELSDLGLLRAPADVARNPAMGNAQARACGDL
jgi:hypothetical protein